MTPPSSSRPLGPRTHQKNHVPLRKKKVPAKKFIKELLKKKVYKTIFLDLRPAPKDIVIKPNSYNA